MCADIASCVDEASQATMKIVIAHLWTMQFKLNETTSKQHQPESN